MMELHLKLHREDWYEVANISAWRMAIMTGFHGFSQSLPIFGACFLKPVIKEERTGNSTIKIATFCDVTLCNLVHSYKKKDPNGQ
jgi:hypothetical protein